MDDAPDNLLAALPRAAAGEVFTELLARPGVRLERIVSAGQTTPADAPMVQDTDEWVLLLAGEAGLRLADGQAIALPPGDPVFLPSGVPHLAAKSVVEGKEWAGRGEFGCRRVLQKNNIQNKHNI